MAETEALTGLFLPFFYSSLHPSEDVEIGRVGCQSMALCILSWTQTTSHMHQMLFPALYFLPERAGGGGIDYVTENGRYELKE